MKNKKTIVLLNLRFSNFYSQTLFERVKADKKVRLVVIVDLQFKDNIGSHMQKKFALCVLMNSIC
jgi:hypothetical protein